MFIKIILYDIWPISINLIIVTCKNNLPIRCHYGKKQQSYCLFLWWLLGANTISKQGQRLWRNPSARQVPSKFTKVKKSGSYLQNIQTNSFQKNLWKKYQKKDRGLEKLPYSKSSYSKLIFLDQPITYSIFMVSLWAIIIIEERTQT